MLSINRQIAHVSCECFLLKKIYKHVFQSFEMNDNAPTLENIEMTPGEENTVKYFLNLEIVIYLYFPTKSKILLLRILFDMIWLL